ncbi:Ig-like domain-containing protein, partial [Vibrio mediterranei]|nr:Ig-like domain-containing protein [Vibrio mediterranei]
MQSGLTLTTDTGDSASDNLTKATTPTLGGHSNEAAHLTVEILDATGQSVLQTVTQSVTANETWSVDVPTALSDGHYTWRVQATDVAGNSSAFVSGAAFEVDATAPVQSGLTLTTDTGDSASDNLTKATTPTLGGHSNEAAHLTVEILDATGQSVLQT